VWLFVAACLLLSVVTLGGVVPIGLSLAGAVVCVLTGRSRTEDDYGKLCYCGGTTILVWIIGFGTALLASVR
jgi:hypothetical protein